MKTKLEKDTIMYTYLEAFEKGYSSGDFSEVFPYLAEDCVMESQWVLTPNELVNTDMHFSGNHHWKLEVSCAIDTSSTAHFYTLVSRGGADIPVRVICSDVLPSIKSGDMLEGQVVTFADSVKKITEAESDGSVIANRNNTVTLNGCLTDVTYADFSFEDKTFEFWELDVETENGGITVLIPCDRIDFSPECGDYISASGVVSRTLQWNTSR